MECKYCDILFMLNVKKKVKIQSSSINMIIFFLDTKCVYDKIFGTCLYVQFNQDFLAKAANLFDIIYIFFLCLSFDGSPSSLRPLINETETCGLI